MLGLLYTIASILLALWIIVLVFHTVFAFAGGFIHLLLVLAIALVLIRIIQGRDPA